MRLVHKIWLESDGKSFGPGPADLLRRVSRTGSLRKAAAELGMSYNKAWWNVKTMEQRLGFPLLTRSVGGATGGGSRLTPNARELLERFDALEADATVALEQLFEKHFQGFSPAQAESHTGPESGWPPGPEPE